tara:strand:+ start:441 stop:3917 length:3477 start_codon:yes stop_codon:yes gene_type:complete
MTTTYTISTDRLKNILGEDDDTSTKKDVQSGSLIDQLSQDENFKVISRYMDDRFGMTTDQYDKEKIIDSYVNNMRKFNFGQSVVTVGELSYLNKGNEQALARRRRLAGDAYNLFDSLGGAFSEGRTVGEKADAVYDYARALVIDPVNILSLGIGKLAASGATKAASQLAKKAAVEAAEAATKKLGKKALTKKGQDKIAQEARKAYTKNIVNDTGYKTALNKALNKEVVATATVDSAAGIGVEALNQKARMKAETQEEYDPVALLFSGVGGIGGGGLAFTLNKLRGTSKIPLYSTLIDQSEQVTLAAREANMTEAAKLIDVAKSVDELDIKVVEDGTSRLSSYADKWAERVKEGLQIRLDNKEIDDNIFDFNHDLELLRYFLFGDKETVKGLRDVLYDAGVQRWSARGKDDRFNLYLGEVIEKLDKSTLDKIQKSFDTIFSNALDDELSKISFKDFMKGYASKASEAGKTLQISKQLNSIFEVAGKEASNITNEQAVNIVLDPAKKGIYKTITEKSAPFQKNFIKYLVMHPGTTALNVKGWIQASSMQSYTDMLKAGLYGLADVVLDGKDSAVSYRNKSKQLIKLQGQKARNILDPYMTYEAAMDYLTFRPEARKELFRYINGGVEVDDVLKELQLNPGEKLTETSFEKITRNLQTLYGVKAQDLLTKTQEFMYSLDKQVRLEYDMTLNEFMTQGNVWEYLSDPASDAYQKFLKIETTAVTEALDNTFSKSFTNVAQARKGDPVAMLAGIIEETRKIPVIGAIAPFGQFFNNTLAFTFKHSGATMIYRKAAGIEQDPFEGIARMAAGWSALALATMKEKKNLDENLAWHEERQSDGQVVSRQYDFPYSHFKVLGRAMAHKLRDGDVPQDLKRVVSEQVGVQGFVRNLGTQGRVLSDLGTSILDLDGTAAGDNGMKLLGEALGMYASGFSRVADPANQIIAMSRGEDYVYADKKQGVKEFNNALRYTDEIFDLMTLGALKKNAVEKKIATQEDTPAVPIGRVLGYRAVEAPSTIEKLFNDVGRSQWKTNLYSIPEATNVINDYIFPYLEMWADTVVKNNWDERTLAEKEKILSDVLVAAKNDVKEVLRVSEKDEPRKAELIFSITNKNLKKSKLRKYLESFGTSEKNLWELDPPQLELILSFLDDEGFRNRMLKSESGLR